MIDVLIHLLIMFSVPIVMVIGIGMMHVHNKYDELWKPLIGLMLFRRPLLRRNLDGVDLFRIGNYGNRVRTLEDLNASMYRLIDALEKRSWFLKHDRRLLNKYYKNLREDLIMREAYERNKRMGEKKYQESYGYKQQQKKQTEAEKVSAQGVWWRKVLGVSANERDPKVIKTAYRTRVSKDHPDKGGTGKKMPDLNKALDAARKELNFV